DSDREPLPERPGSPIRFNDGKALLERHTEALLGPKPPLRSVRIMVTMPSEAADDYLCIRGILAGAWAACGSTARTTMRSTGEG
ncbi:MAG: pyruvate kinase, partial [Deltaproteobacteria bacterium]|nr:pyruvate kinase [Deltaproteobacteria bacterium]